MTSTMQWSYVYVRPHFGTDPVPALVVQFRNWNVNIPKLAPCQFRASSSGTGCPVPELVLTRFAMYSILEPFWNRVPSVETPNQISLVPELASRQKKVGADLGTLTFQFWNWMTSAGTGSVPKWGLTYTSPCKQCVLCQLFHPKT